MNNFLKKNNKLFFSLFLGLLLNNSLAAVTFRNEPLTNFVQPGEVLSATFPENYYIILNMESNNFDINQGNIENLNNLKETFQDIKDGRSGCSISSSSFNTSSNIINYNSSYLNGRENINIQGKTFVKLIHCLLESPLISITGNRMTFLDSFFINPEILNIIVDAPGSDYDSIQILFYDQPEKPTVITGEIDFRDNETAKKLIISNVKEIRVKFIWDKNLSKKSNTEETSTITKNSHPQKSDFKNRAAVTKNLQPHYTSYQWSDKPFLKEIINDLFSPDFMPITALSVALLLYCISGDFLNKIKN